MKFMTDTHSNVRTTADSIPIADIRREKSISVPPLVADI